MIEAPGDVWDLYLKTDSNARTMRIKTWPFYSDWCEIFGKDSVARENAVSFVDPIKEMETNKGKEKQVVAEFGCVFETESNGTEKKQAPRKRKMMSECSSDPFVEAINVFCDKLDARFEDIVRRIGYGYEVSTARRQVYFELGKIEELLVRDKLIVIPTTKFHCHKHGVERTPEEKAIDAWLPISSSRNAKWWYSAFHNVTAMVGAGILSLPFAKSELGWCVKTSFLLQSNDGTL